METPATGEWVANMSSASRWLSLLFFLIIIFGWRLLTQGACLVFADLGGAQDGSENV